MQQHLWNPSPTPTTGENTAQEKQQTWSGRRCPHVHFSAGSPKCPLSSPKCPLRALSSAWRLISDRAEQTPPVQNKLFPFPKWKSSPARLGSIREPSWSSKRSLPTRTRGSQPSLQFKNLLCSNSPNGISSQQLPHYSMPSQGSCSDPATFKGGEKASSGLSSHPAFCSILHFTVGDQSSPDITTAQKKLHVSHPPAWGCVLLQKQKLQNPNLNLYKRHISNSNEADYFFCPFTLAT